MIHETLATLQNEVKDLQERAGEPDKMIERMQKRIDAGIRVTKVLQEEIERQNKNIEILLMKPKELSKEIERLKVIIRTQDKRLDDLVKFRYETLKNKE